MFEWPKIVLDCLNFSVFTYSPGNHVDLQQCNKSSLQIFIDFYDVVSLSHVPINICFKFYLSFEWHLLWGISKIILSRRIRNFYYLLLIYFELMYAFKLSKQEELYASSYLLGNVNDSLCLLIKLLSKKLALV